MGFHPLHTTSCHTPTPRKTAASLGQTVNLVGGEELTLDEIGEGIADALGIRKTVVHIPMPVMRMAAAMFSLVPIKPPVTKIQLRMLEEGSTADPEPMKRIFGIEPVRFREGVRRDLLGGSKATS